MRRVRGAEFGEQYANLASVYRTHGEIESQHLVLSCDRRTRSTPATRLLPCVTCCAMPRYGLVPWNPALSTPALPGPEPRARTARDLKMIVLGHSFELRQFRVHQVPRLRARNIDVSAGLIPARVVQASSAQHSPVRTQPVDQENRRAACRTKRTSHLVPPVGGGFMPSRGTGQRKVGFLDDYGRKVSAACGALTVAAVAISHVPWCGCTGVSDRAAGAATGKCIRHVTVLHKKQCHAARTTFPARKYSRVIRPKLCGLLLCRY